CLSQVMNPPSRPAAVCQSRDVRSHQRRYNASASAYAFVVLSAASWPKRRCCKYPSATPTTRYSPSTTVQYRTDDGSLTRNARIPDPPTTSKRADPTGQTVTSVHATPKEPSRTMTQSRPFATMHDSRRTRREQQPATASPPMMQDSSPQCGAASR